jgi:hypothetical protein
VIWLLLSVANITVLKRIHALVKLDSNIAVLWLYGSRAKGTEFAVVDRSLHWIAKQSLEGIGKEVPADARKTFSKLRMLGRPYWD